jgi:SAM-dependent methyltransferase
METNHYLHLRKNQERHWFYRYRRNLLRRHLGKLLHGNEGAEILDYGAGTGANLPALLPYGRVTCIEPVDIAVEIIKREWPTCTVFQGSTDSLANREELQNHFDLILASYVLYHQEVTSPEATLRVLRSFSKAGGYLINLEPAFDSLYRRQDKIVHGARRFTKESLNARHQAAGWEPVESYYLLPSLFLAGWVLARVEKKSDQPTAEHRSGDSALTNQLMKTWIGSIESACSHLHLPFGVGILTISKAR